MFFSVEHAPPVITRTLLQSEHTFFFAGEGGGAGSLQVVGCGQGLSKVRSALMGMLRSSKFMSYNHKLVCKGYPLPVTQIVHDVFTLYTFFFIYHLVKV